MKKKKINSDNEKNNNVIVIVSTCLVALLAGIGIYRLYNNDNPEPKENDAIYLGMKSEILMDVRDGYKLLTSYDEYSKYFDNDEVTEKDFKNNNYILIQVDYNECSETDLKLNNYTIKDDKVKVNFTYTAKCGFCAPQYMYYLIGVEKKETDYKVETDFKATNNPDCPRDVAYKPMIYLYPDKEMDVVVKLGNPQVVTTSYPRYTKEWNVKAYPNGKLIDNNTNRELYGLYWEGNNHKVGIKDDGFVVKGEDTIEFLEEKLEILGLNEREANEFIVYWLPKLEVNKYNYIRFETNDEINNYMPLEITPKPDNVIRILMDYKPIDKYINVNEQELVTPKRTGFTVVEWGGSLID